MTQAYTINDYQYTISFADGKLMIKAINYATLTDYFCYVESSTIEGYKLIESLEMLHDILDDAMISYNEDNESVINIHYDKKKDVINIDLTIKFKYFSEIINFKLLKPEVIEDSNLIHNKLTYYSKRLADYDEQIAKVDKLEKMVENLTERITDLVSQTADFRMILFYPGHHAIDIPTSKKISIRNDHFLINRINYGYSESYPHPPGNKISTKLRPDEQNDYKYKEHLHLLNKLTYLEDIEIYNMSDLDMIKDCKNVENLAIHNCPELTNIDVVTRFENLENITINGCPNIKNIHVLEDCESLQKVNISSTMNTSVFSKSIKFVITRLN